MAYWFDRIRDTNEVLYTKSVEECGQHLAHYYRRAAKRVRSEIEILLTEIERDLVNDTFLISDLYRYDRYFILMNTLNQHLTSLGFQEIKIDKKYIKRLYELTEANVENFTPFPTFQTFGSADAILNTVWCADGKLWSDRIWDNKRLLQSRLEEALVDGIVRGKPRDRIVKNVMNTFNVGFNDANRIIRTELTFAQTQACADRYKSAGIKKYKYLAEIDKRTSEICQELDGQEFYFSDAVVGENMPPCHPNCRSTIIPVLE